MILPQYRVAPSTIPGAGKGVFVEESVPCGRILVAPDAIPWADLAFPSTTAALRDLLASC